MRSSLRWNPMKYTSDKLLEVQQNITRVSSYFNFAENNSGASVQNEDQNYDGDDDHNNDSDETYNNDGDEGKLCY